MTERRPCFIFAGGGSGGHLSPGLAIAERLRELDKDVSLHFICSNRAIDRTMLAPSGFDFTPIDAAPLSVRPRGLWRFVKQFGRAKKHSMQLLNDLRATHVIALGGFVAAPVVSAARKLGIDITMLNLDAVPGKANRWMARKCDVIFSAVPTPKSPNFAQEIVGLPIRRQAIAAGDRAHCRREMQLNPDLNTLLITGASQGSGSINNLITAFVNSHPEALRGWQVIHLTGRIENAAQIEQAYAAHEIPALVQPFLHEMGLAWGAADLVVCRAGANTIAELRANAVPALLLPYPFHRDMHQRDNAQPVAEIGGAVVCDDHVQTQANLAEAGRELQRLLTDDPARQVMHDALAANMAGDAALDIARRLLSSPTASP